MTNGFGNFGFPTRFVLGLDELVENLSKELKTQTYPPHNIFKHSDNSYTLELAVAGYRKEELSVYCDNNEYIVVQGAQDRTDTDGVTVHKGISSKDFSIKFKILPNMQVAACGVNNGILTIRLSPPYEAKPQRVGIPIK